MNSTLKDLTKQARKNGQHPRTLIVATASAKIGMAVAQIEEQFHLTHYELVKCVSDYLSLSMKYALRVERHDDAEIGADEPPVLKKRRARA